MIYIVGKSFGAVGGGAFVAMDLLDSLMKSDYGAGVICVNYKIPPRYSEKFKDVPRIEMPYVPEKDSYTGNRLGSVRYVLKSLQCRKNQYALRRQLKSNPPSLMFINDSTYHTRVVQNEFGKKSKTAQIVHISPKFIDDFHPEYDLSEFFEAYSQSDALIFVSDECRKKWVAHEILQDKKTYYIPNCANEEIAHECLSNSKQEMRGKLDLDPDKFYLISAATLQKRKGQDLLVEAAPQLKKIAPNLEILMAGGGEGEFGAQLKERVKKDGLNYVTFLGRKSNVMEYIYASDAFILTSRAEALPLVILEAMILKTPVIASNIDGVPEMIENNRDGVLFGSDNVDELIASFEKIYHNKEKRDLYAESANEKYWRLFSKELFTERYVNAVQEILE